ncbi:MAG: amidase, partial [Lentibacter algarum]
MSGSRLCTLSACEILAAFAAKTLTPSEYLTACLEQITQFNPKINALAAMDVEGAVVSAEEATQRWQSYTPMGP